MASISFVVIKNASFVLRSVTPAYDFLQFEFSFIFNWEPCREFYTECDSDFQVSLKAFFQFVSHVDKIWVSSSSEKKKKN